MKTSFDLRCSMEDDVNFTELARSTDDFNGAQLKAAGSSGSSPGVPRVTGGVWRGSAGQLGSNGW